MTGEGVIHADGLGKALIGYTDLPSGERVAVYSAAKVIGLLMERDGMEYDDAVEFFDFNIAGAHVGPGTPIFVDPK